MCLVASQLLPLIPPEMTLLPQTMKRHYLPSAHQLYAGDGKVLLLSWAHGFRSSAVPFIRIVPTVVFSIAF